MIPQIIHQIAPKNKDSWHPFWERCQESWTKQFSNFEYKLWNDKEDIDNFVKQYYPKYYNLYMSFPVHIMKIDFARMCILHHFGGIYADMDVFCYQNFYEDLTEDLYFVENLTNEFTTAKYENPLMISVKGLPFFEFCMMYSKIWFIQWKNRFEKTHDKWRSVENSFLVNNITGSCMLSGALMSAKQKVTPLNCREFNNRPGSYHPSFKTKHVHTSLWGNEYLDTKDKKLLIYKGLVYMGSYMNNSILNLDLVMLDFDEFDFYHDYTNNIFLQEDNLEYIKKYIRESDNELRVTF
jgi:hypothetical protein